MENSPHLADSENLLERLNYLHFCFFRLSLLHYWVFGAHLYFSLENVKQIFVVRAEEQNWMATDDGLHWRFKDKTKAENEQHQKKRKKNQRNWHWVVKLDKWDVFPSLRCAPAFRNFSVQHTTRYTSTHMKNSIERNGRPASQYACCEYEENIE